MLYEVITQRPVIAICDCRRNLDLPTGEIEAPAQQYRDRETGHGADPDVAHCLIGDCPVFER